LLKQACSPFSDSEKREICANFGLGAGADGWLQLFSLNVRLQRLGWHKFDLDFFAKGRYLPTAHREAETAKAHRG